MGVVHRTARIRLRVTAAQAVRCFRLLRSDGDVWAALTDVNRARFARGARPIANYQEWCREIAGVRVGELAATAMRSVVQRYSDAFFETARRRQRGEQARYPRRKRALFPLRWYHDTFAIEERRVRLATARGAPDLWVRLSRDLPYPSYMVRSVTLLVDAGRLCLDVTAAVPIESHDVDSTRVAGVDLGIIHPYAVAAGDEALLVSGRQIRAEERLHLADTNARARRMGSKAPRRGERGSRRWRKLRAAQRRAETRHRRRVRLAHHQAAKSVIAWALEQRVGALSVGDPVGITGRDVGRRQNLRLRQWRRTHLLRTLLDKAEVAGIRVRRVDERRTSSTCPECHERTPKAGGREFSCPHCGHEGHRDLIAARNIAGRSGGITSTTVLVTHRRAGVPPARRDRRRHRMDARRSCPAPSRPRRRRGSRSPVNPIRALARTPVHVDSLDARRGSGNAPNPANVA